jgi:hypothetical protein
VSAYFPKAQWYDYYTGQITNYGGAYATLSAPVSYIPVHLRGGSILATQAPELTTAKTRANAFNLVAALDANYQARGELFWDDGVSINSIAQQNYTKVTFGATKNSFQMLVDVAGYNATPNIASVSVWGLPSAPTSVKFNNSPLSSSQFSYNSATKILTITSLSASANVPFTLQWQ